jgi:hypothetical protein
MGEKRDDGSMNWDAMDLRRVKGGWWKKRELAKAKVA